MSKHKLKTTPEITKLSEKFKITSEKLKEVLVIPIYLDKYYKQYCARLKVNQIKPKDFNFWRYKAITMRNECIDGKITIKEYIDWNEAAFPNRTKKS